MSESYPTGESKELPPKLSSSEVHANNRRTILELLALADDLDQDLSLPQISQATRLSLKTVRKHLVGIDDQQLFSTSQFMKTLKDRGFNEEKDCKSILADAEIDEELLEQLGGSYSNLCTNIENQTTILKHYSASMRPDSSINIAHLANKTNLHPMTVRKHLKALDLL